MKPLLRWAGGKQGLIKEIFEVANIEDAPNYFEPFLGAASFFLRGNFSRAYLSDCNADLINFYKQVRETPEQVFDELNRFRRPVSDKTYYRIRDEYNKNIGVQSISQAVRFAFLNRTSFNGIYRVNAKGHYNVPFGKSLPSFSAKEDFIALSKKLKNAEILCADFEYVGSIAMHGDLVYFDPPYPKLSNTAYFAHYTLDKFDFSQQIRLGELSNSLASRGCNIIVSNADLPDIRAIYRGWNIHVCSAFRYVSCKKERVKVKELIIKNF